MDAYSRTTQSTSANVTRIERPFSNFKFIDQNFDGLPSLRRIMSQVRQHKGLTMVEEILGTVQDLREENEDLTKRYGQAPDSNV